MIEFASNSESATRGAHDYARWVALAFYVLFLLYRAWNHGQTNEMATTPLWQLQDSNELLQWLGTLALRGVYQCVYFIPLGLLTALAAPPGLVWPRRFAISLWAVLLAGVLTALVMAVEIKSAWSWHLAAATGLTLPLAGSLLGVWMGTTWLRGRRARMWLLPKVTGLVLLAAFCVGGLLWQSTQDTPLMFEPAHVTSAEKRRLVHLFRSKSPRELSEGQTHTLQLTEHDIDVLLAWGLSLGSPDRKAKVTLAPDVASLVASVGAKFGGKKTRYLNLVAAGVPELREGVLNLNLKHLQLGAVQIPRWLLRLLSPVATSLVHHDPRSKPFLEAIRAIAIEPGGIAVTYGPVHLSSHGFREDLFGPASAGKAVLASTQAQVNHLVAVVNQQPDTPAALSECFETAFIFARSRSIAGDPVTENRAAIFALGMLMGHPRVEEFLGPVHAGRGNLAARRALSRVPLRGRSDWTKHFCVAAAIALLSDEIVSDAAGLLKEELDADKTGSGFSFSDLLAARAGTTFAIEATRNKATALAMQERIAKGFDVEQFCPPAADLPEGISDAELQEHYGGVGGAAYSQVIEEIEQRIAACAAYR